MKAPIKLTAGRKNEFVQALKELGGSSGNIQLMEKLGWEKKFYERTRESLGAQIRVGPGHGGVVHLTGNIEQISKDGRPRKDRRALDNNAFIAMPFDATNPDLEDVLETIKQASAKCGIHATRIDDEQSIEKITDRIIEAINNSQFVIANLTKERPNVFFEAGYAHGKGKIPIYIAREGTTVHFDLKDYPIIFFKNNKNLREELIKRLRALKQKRPLRRDGRKG
jgi:nucleoside 2-deoxyribosyltransferase